MFHRVLAMGMSGMIVLLLLLVSSPAIASDDCEKLGACTLSGGACGVECNGECLSFDEARCCMAGMCYRDGSWCGGVAYNGDCLSPDEARCLMSGCRLANGDCVCAPGASQ